MADPGWDSAAAERRVTVLQLLVSTAIGGGPRHVVDVVRGLPRDRFDVVVGAPADGPCFDEFRALGVRIHALPVNRLSLRGLVAVARLARSSQAQVIHSHGKGAGLYGRLAGWWTGVPVVHTLHGIHYHRYPPGVRWLYLWLERRLARLSHAIVHVSESQARQAARLGLDQGRQRVIVNGIDAAEVRAAAASQPIARASLGLGPDDQVVGTVARLDRVKGLDVLVGAMIGLRRRCPAAALVVVGEGPARAAVERHVRAARLDGRVRLAGAVVGAARICPALDVYVSASWGEGLPLALLEAMACGLPVVATRVTGHVDVVVDGVTGFLVPPGDPAALADRIEQLLGDEPLRRALGQAGRARVDVAFRRDAMVAGLAALYEEAAGEARGR
jgi:glycosyltransferase involved in cell wall biosynthesis